MTRVVTPILDPLSIGYADPGDCVENIPKRGTPT
jgi:hypothetical protein